MVFNWLGFPDCTLRLAEALRTISNIYTNIASQGPLLRGWMLDYCTMSFLRWGDALLHLKKIFYRQLTQSVPMGEIYGGETSSKIPRQCNSIIDYS